MGKPREGDLKAAWKALLAFSRKTIFTGILDIGNNRNQPALPKYSQQSSFPHPNFAFLQSRNQVGSSNSQNSARNPSCDGGFFGKLSTFPIGICSLEWGQGTFGLGSKAWKTLSLFPIILRDEFRDEFTSPGQGIIGFIQFLFLLSGIILSSG